MGAKGRCSSHMMKVKGRVVSSVASLRSVIRLPQYIVVRHTFWYEIRCCVLTDVRGILSERSRRDEVADQRLAALKQRLPE